MGRETEEFGQPVLSLSCFFLRLSHGFGSTLPQKCSFLYEPPVNIYLSKGQRVSGRFLTGLTFPGCNSVRLALHPPVFKVSESDLATSGHFGFQKHPAPSYTHFAATIVLKACLKVD